MPKLLGGPPLLRYRDDTSKLKLYFEAGKLMTYLTSEDPEHWMHVLPARRSLLTAAAEGFLSLRSLRGSFLQCCHAHLILLKSDVTEARALQLRLEERAEDTKEDGDRLERLYKVSDVAAAARVSYVVGLGIM